MLVIVGNLYSNILGKEASSLGFCAHANACVHACMCVMVIMGVVSVFPVCWWSSVGIATCEP